MKSPSAQAYPRPKPMSLPVSKQLRPYQQRLISCLPNYPRAMLHVDMGLGKTVIMLHVAADLMARGQVWGVLVVAPKLVAQTVWAQEAQDPDWQGLHHLTIVRILGTASNRAVALRSPADVYVINYENLPWLVDETKRIWLAEGNLPPWNMIILDEITKVKSAGRRNRGKWGNALREILPWVPWRYGLTGTPAPNGYQDLFGQYLVIDDGKSLGKTRRGFYDRWFIQVGDPRYEKYVLAPGGKEGVEKAIAPITHSLQAKDYVTLPDEIQHDIWIELPPANLKTYRSFERELWVRMDNGEDLEVEETSAMLTKCRQLAGGYYYPDPHDSRIEVFHTQKLAALKELIEELAGNPLLLIYQFRAELHYLRKLPDSEYIGPGVNGKQASSIIDRWNQGDVPVLITHPDSMGHGVNIQHGGHNVCWYNPTYNLEHLLQTHGRLIRPGQKHSHVTIHRILARRTIDEAIIQTNRGKQTTQQSLRDAIDEYRRNN